MNGPIDAARLLDAALGWAASGPGPAAQAPAVEAGDNPAPADEAVEALADTPGRCPDCGGPQWRDGVGRERCAACDAGRLRAALTEAGFGDWLTAVEAEAAPADGEPLPGWADPAGWRELAGGVLVRTDNPEAASLHWDGLEEPGDGCPVCGSIAFWEDYNGRRRCGACEPGPLDDARALAERAADLRRRHPPRPRPARRGAGEVKDAGGT